MLGSPIGFGAGYGITAGAGAGSIFASSSFSRLTPRREREAVGVDRLAQEARQIGAVLGVKVRVHRGG
jgi:hypothetical protein